MILKPVHCPFIVKRQKKAETVAGKIRPDDTFNSKVTQSHKGMATSSECTYSYLALLEGNYAGDGS